MKDLGAQLPPWLMPAAFPLLFASMWFAVTVILTRISGWHELMQRFPDRGEAPLLALKNQSGQIGSVLARNILNLSVCPSGLRVGIMRIFGPFSRPFFVPWADLRVTRKENWVWRSARFTFGVPPVGRLTLAAELADTLARAAGSRWPEPGSFPVEANGPAAARIFKQWLVSTAFAATFFTVAPRLMNPRDAAPPIEIAILFPAIVFGVVGVFRYLTRTRS
jgi:hypothetical protein